MGKTISDAVNPLAEITPPLKNPTGLVNVDSTRSNQAREVYSVAMNAVSPILPAYTPKQDNTGQLLADLKFCNKYPTTLSATGNPFTDGPSSDRFNEMCGMCMTEGRLVTGEKFPNKGSPGPPGTGIVVYPEDKQVAGITADAIPSFSCAHCSPIFLDSPTPNVRPVAINSDQYVATLQYMADNDLLYDNGCTSTKTSMIQCNNSDKKIAELNLFYGSWNEGTCGQVSESDGEFNPVRTQSTDNIGCYGKADCTINFSPTVLATKEWELEGRCDYMAPPLRPASHTVNVDCLPVILSEAPSTQIASAIPIWGYNVNGSNGNFRFTRDYTNPSTTKSFKAVLSVCLWNTTGKVFINGKAVTFQTNGADVERITGCNTTHVIIPIGTSRISVHTEQTSYATPSVSLNLANVNSPSNYILVSDTSWVYVLDGYRQSFPTVNGYCGFIPSAYAGYSDLANFNGNQEALANHWITKGLFEGRSPCGSCGFDDKEYHCINLDVQAAGMDPKTHYVQYGFREGRKIRENGCAPCKPPPKVRVYEHCDAAGWSTTLGGGIYSSKGNYNANVHFGGDASYIKVEPGLTAILQNNGGRIVRVDGPGEFNFCALAGFNDNVRSIDVIDSNSKWGLKYESANEAIDNQRRAEEEARRREEERRRAEEEARRRAEEARRRAEEEAERVRRRAEELARQQREAMEGVARAAQAATQAAANVTNKCTIM